MSETIAAPPGWYFVRIEGDGNGHLIRYPIGAWSVTADREAVPLVAKPGRRGLARPTEDDEAALVGFLPPDRELGSYFSSEDVQDALKRTYVLKHPDDWARRQAASVREVNVPGVGRVPVRDARPPTSAQTGTDDWIRRAWPGGPQRGLPGDGGH